MVLLNKWCVEIPVKFMNNYLGFNLCFPQYNANPSSYSTLCYIAIITKIWHYLLLQYSHEHCVMFPALVNIKPMHFIFFFNMITKNWSLVGFTFSVPSWLFNREILCFHWSFQQNVTATWFMNCHFFVPL